MLDALFQQVHSHLRRGEFAAAQTLCRETASRHLQNAAIRTLWAQSLRLGGQFADAAQAARDSLAIDTQQPAAWRELAIAELESGQLAQAEVAARNQRLLLPNDNGAAFLLGHVLGLRHHFDEAQPLLAGLQPATQFAQARLGLVHDALARRDAAAAQFHAQALTQVAPQAAAVWDALGQAEAARGQLDASAAALREASRLAPADVAILQRLASVLDAQRRGGDEPVDIAQRLLQLQPDSPAAHERLLLAQLGAHRTADAVASARALQQHGHSQLLGRWVEFHTPALPCYASEDERAAWLADWQRGLAEFEALDPQRPGLGDAARAILGSVPNFALTYHDGAHVDLHRRHARVVRTLLAAACGQRIDDVAVRALRSGRRRIGVVSHCLYQHSVSRAWGEAILALPSDDFELVVFYTGSREDASVQRFRQRAQQFHSGSQAFATWDQHLRAADLDVLIFLDLGLDVTNQCLAAVRYAPVQVATWAHPATSGAPSIDYFLSAALTEPTDGASHYSERLHCLPGLGGCFAQPTQAVAAVARAAHTELTCLQNLYKLHPQHDAVFARILAGAPQARLRFLTAATTVQAAGFRHRLQPLLREHGVDPDRVVIEPVLAAADYHAAIAASDLILDTFGFSGGITTLDALWQERPQLTVPGTLMRGRQSAAMLQCLQLDSLVARDSDHYVQRAVALATDADERTHLRRCIAERKHLLFDDRRACTALADFLRQVDVVAVNAHG